MATVCVVNMQACHLQFDRNGQRQSVCCACSKSSMEIVHCQVCLVCQTPIPAFDSQLVASVMQQAMMCSTTRRQKHSAAQSCHLGYNFHAVRQMSWACTSKVEHAQHCESTYVCNIQAFCVGGRQAGAFHGAVLHRAELRYRCGVCRHDTQMVDADAPEPAPKDAANEVEVEYS